MPGHRQRRLRLRRAGRGRLHAPAPRARRLPLRHAARAADVAPGALGGLARRHDAVVHRLLGGGRELRRLRRRDEARARRRPGRRAARGRAHRAALARRLSRHAAAGVHRRPRRRPRGCTSCRRARWPSTPTGRSRSTATATRSPSCPARCACSPRRSGCSSRHERDAGRQAGRRQGGRGARAARAGAAAGRRCRARSSRAWSRAPSACWPRRLRRGSVVLSATNGKTTTAAMVASVLERTGARLVHNRAGANMAGGVASALAAASRRGGRELDGDLGLFEVDEFWLAAVVSELEPRALLLANLFRDQLDRYGELETIADRWAAVVEAERGHARLVLNADDPLVADLGRDDPEAIYFGVAGRRRHPRRAPARLGLQALPPLRRGLRLRRRLPRPPRPLPLPQLRRAAARPGGVRRGDRAARDPLGGVHADHPGGPRARRAAAARPLQRLQRARRRRALPRARGAARDDRGGDRGGRAGLRAGGDARPRRAADVDPAGQEPGGRQRGAAHARARGAGPRAARRARRAQRQHRRRPRRLVGVGRRLGAAGRPRASG